MSFTREFPLLGAAALATLVRTGEVSPVDVTRAAFDAIDRLEPQLHAFATQAQETAIAAAADIEHRIARNEPVGALAGVPVAVKDLVMTKDLRTTFGSRLYADFVPDHDDIVVERLKAADAIVIGKTNVSEFGFGAVGHNPLFPTTRNPWDLERTPGGSSAGSASAVAAGICPLAIGSDGGGSVRVPASFTGIVGFKASMGRVPLWPGCRDERFPGASGWESIEHIGPMARSVEDAALLLDVISGPDPRDRLSIPADRRSWRDRAHQDPRPGLRIAYCPAWADLPVDPEVRAIVDAAVAVLEGRLGHQVELAPSPFGDLIETFRSLVALETDITGLRAMARGRECDLGGPVRDLIARSYAGDVFCDAVTARKAAVNAMARFMAKFDLLVTPTVPVLPFPIDWEGPGIIAGVAVADDAWTPFSYPANLTGQPALNVPAGWTATGLPVGLQIMGRHLGDDAVLELAASFERACPWSDRRPACRA